MKKNRSILCLSMILALMSCTLIGCGSSTAFDNPGDTLGGGGVVDDVPTETNSVSSSSIDTQIGKNIYRFNY
ncbi:MAG: hypothetical protein H6690_02630 [Erysipelotrichaceae bacterium]|nr:hypothetical protein [Erysipelotrichaceae bacterium]